MSAQPVRWHDGLSSEELDQEASVARAHQLSDKHRSDNSRRAVIALVLCFAAILALGILVATMVRVAPTPEMVRTSDADILSGQSVLHPPRK